MISTYVACMTLKSILLVTWSTELKPVFSSVLNDFNVKNLLNLFSNLEWLLYSSVCFLGLYKKVRATIPYFSVLYKNGLRLLVPLLCFVLYFWFFAGGRILHLGNGPNEAAMCLLVTRDIPSATVITWPTTQYSCALQNRFQYLEFKILFK